VPHLRRSICVRSECGAGFRTSPLEPSCKGCGSLATSKGKPSRWWSATPRGGKSGCPSWAVELVRLGVDIIVAGTSAAVKAAMNATRTIPIVMAGGGDPVGLGFVASLARPGGNVTGRA